MLRTGRGVQRELLDKYFGMALVPRTYLKHRRVNNKLFLMLRPCKEMEFLSELMAVDVLTCRNRAAFQKAVSELQALVEWIQLENAASLLINSL